MQTYWLSLSLVVTLSACAPALPPAPNFSGSWEDGAAAFTTCGDTLPVAVGLELLQTDAYLQGTFTLQGNPSTFAGEVKQGRITGAVRGDNGSSLTAELSPRGDRLVGTFTAVEETGCTAGSSSVTRYEVDMAR